MNAPVKAAQVSEFVVNATVDELNAELDSLGIGISQILSVIFIPEAALAIGDADAKFRVLYSTHAR